MKNVRTPQGGFFWLTLYVDNVTKYTRLSIFDVTSKNCAHKIESQKQLKRAHNWSQNFHNITLSFSLKTKSDKSVCNTCHNNFRNSNLLNFTPPFLRPLPDCARGGPPLLSPLLSGYATAYRKEQFMICSGKDDQARMTGSDEQFLQLKWTEMKQVIA